MKRIVLFLAPNLAIVLVLSISMGLWGVEPWLNAQGLNVSGLLVFAAVMGFGGSFMSLALSRWMTKKTMGARVIEAPANPTEAWLIAGGGARGIKRLFMTHPPLAERIAALKAEAGR